MRLFTQILLGSLAVCAMQTPALAQPTTPGSTPNGPLHRPTDPPLTPGNDPARPNNPSLPPSTTPSASPGTTPGTEPATPGNLPDPAAPGAPSDPMNPATPTDVPSPSATPGAPGTADDNAPPVSGALVTADSDVTLGQTDSLSYAWTDSRLASGIGVSAVLGGGLVGFTDKTMRSTTADLGGLWDLRVTIGSHIPLALDISYLGSATNINGLPAGRNGTLVGTTVEGALRYNILSHAPINPYIFGGVGWQRYDVTETNVTLSDSGMNDHDNLLEFPMGAGVQYRMGGFVGDLRGTFRAMTDQNLVLKNPTASPTSDDFAPMHTWEASAAVGYEF